jgi:NitT/TauT family transport system ATP-binding protein
VKLWPGNSSAAESLSPPGSALSLSDVSKLYGNARAPVRALDGLTLDVGVGEFVCLVGASGCGKSTLLNLIAGLDHPTAGRIDVRGGRTTLLFQEGALFPWLTVAQNVDLPLRLRGLSRGSRREIIEALLGLVHLTGFERRRPHELSGGMRQRVALARALAQQAEILLMDEPFGALDSMTRDVLHDELERLWRDTGLTIVFVTHNVREAVRLSDRVVLLTSRPGRIAAQFPIDLPRPRRIESPEVAAIAGEITERLRAEVRLHGTTG